MGVAGFKLVGETVFHSGMGDFKTLNAYGAIS
jgi:hypothetical protein